MKFPMYHHHHRTWFPYILIGLTVALVLAVVAWSGPTPADDEHMEDLGHIQAPEVLTEEEYRSAVNEVWLTYTIDEDASQAYATLLDMVVPTVYKEVHLELVIILRKIEAQKIEEAQARYDLLRQSNPWLSEVL